MSKTPDSRRPRTVRSCSEADELRAEARRIGRESRVAQGFPVKIEDETVLRDVAVMVAAQRVERSSRSTAAA